MRVSRVGPFALALGIVGWIGVGSLERQVTLQAMVDASNAFLASLSDSERAATTFDFADDERLRHHFIPPETFPREGVRVKDLNPAQEERAQAMLAASLSTRGHSTVKAIMEVEGLLPAIEGPNRPFARDPEDYWISVFGTPSPTGTWGWRWEGHHLSLHFTVVDGTLTVSAPTFLATFPARVPDGQPRAGFRALELQEESARALLAALTPEQRQAAIFQDVAPRDIVTGAEMTVTPLDPPGIRASALTSPQRDLLMAVVDAYVGVMNEDIARVRMDRIRAAGPENLAFAWAGSTERGQRAYYRVQGPTFLIEFDNAQNDPNHIHTTFRDFAGDLGRDLLRDHVQSDH